MYCKALNLKKKTTTKKNKKTKLEYQGSHHCSLFVREVDSDGASTSRYIFWTGLSRGGVTGGGGRHSGKSTASSCDAANCKQLLAKRGSKELPFYFKSETIETQFNISNNFLNSHNLKWLTDIYKQRKKTHNIL